MNDIKDRKKVEKEVEEMEFTMETWRRIRFLVDDYFEDLGGALGLSIDSSEIDKAGELDKIVSEIAQLLGIESVN